MASRFTSLFSATVVLVLLAVSFAVIPDSARSPSQDIRGGGFAPEAPDDISPSAISGPSGGEGGEPGMAGDASRSVEASTVPSYPVSDCSLTSTTHSVPTYGPQGRAEASRLEGTKEIIIIGANFTYTDHN